VAGFCQYGDERAGSGAMELVSYLRTCLLAYLLSSPSAYRLALVT
jgi:hypothetical protein